MCNQHSKSSSTTSTLTTREAATKIADYLGLTKTSSNPIHFKTYSVVRQKLNDLLHELECTHGHGQASNNPVISNFCTHFLPSLICVYKAAPYEHGPYRFMLGKFMRRCSLASDLYILYVQQLLRTTSKRRQTVLETHNALLDLLFLATYRHKYSWNIEGLPDDVSEDLQEWLMSTAEDSLQKFRAKRPADLSTTSPKYEALATHGTLPRTVIYAPFALIRMFSIGKLLNKKAKLKDLPLSSTCKWKLTYDESGEATKMKTALSCGRCGTITFCCSEHRALEWPEHVIKRRNYGLRMLTQVRCQLCVCGVGGGGGASPRRPNAIFPRGGNSRGMRLRATRPGKLYTRPLLSGQLDTTLAKRMWIPALPARMPGDSFPTRLFSAASFDNCQRLPCSSNRSLSIFHDPALDALWWEQDTIMNLMRCMPDVWKTLTLPPGLLTAFLNITAARPIIASDWDRVKRYSHRVRSLKSLDIDGLALSHVFEAIQLGAPDGHLLPNLRHFAWGHTNKDLLPFIDLFLGPNITTFGIGSVQHNAHYSVLANVAHRYPALVGVFIGHLEPDEDYSDDEDYDGDSADKEGSVPRPTDCDLCTFVCAMTEPQFVDVGTLDLAALTHLGASNGTLFPHLQIVKLQIERGDILGMTELVRTWNCPPLQSLEIQFETKSYDRFTSSIGLQSFQEFHDALSTHCAPASVEIFKFDATDDRDSNAREFVYPGHLLRSLICFSNLIDVSIQVLNGYELDDEVVSDLAHGWPISFALERVLTAIIRALAQHCLHLHTLEMTFDATTIPAAATTPQARIIQNSLVVLDLAFSHISDVFPIARFLSGMFTSLGQMESANDRQAWNEVMALVVQLHEIRKEEVIRGQSLMA
ncbi:hypothetical protein C8J57DRAFT_1231990 [Mycena rebaudengoi]|nr:hypothetical protein C8J57DRAFT_1231990 [Mycena rebaudengoi]